HRATGRLLQRLTKRIDLASLGADDNSRPRRRNRDLAAVTRPLDLDLRDPRVEILPLDLVAKLDVLVKELRELLAIGEPARLRRARDSKPQANWINFLTHACSPMPTCPLPAAYTIPT